MQFKTTITDKDYNGFCRLIVKNIKLDILTIISVSLVVYVIMEVFLNILEWFGCDIKSIVFDSHTILYFVLFMFIVSGISYFIKLKKMYPIEDGIVLGVHEITLTENQFIDKKDGFETFITYEKILKIEEDNRTIFLFVDKTAAYLVNKESIDSTLSVNEIIDFIKKKCNHTS